MMASIQMTYSRFMIERDDNMDFGKLYICATPIGNLEDISLRTLRILNEVDFIAAEDTRHTLKLLNHFDIKKTLTSYHQHNIKEKGPKLIEKLKAGQTMALVSDAGMPGISDPGEHLIGLAIEEEIEVIGLPGASAMLLALVISGLSTEKFAFEGFLPTKKNERIRELEKVKEESRTLIFYESPHRIVESLEAMILVLGDRKASLSRELTKKFEETIRGKLSEIIEIASVRELKGEMVVVLEGYVKPEENIDIEEMLNALILSGMTKKDAVRKVVKETGISKNLVYAESLKIEVK
ncbi:MAG: 16S rRNA (cytidine(1402)-2'-O)-methyltransferase [Gudongella sp.]|nr:16S rRNA (cytidine(1402)-2'-O)-methyltransferase [Gudongella sp.]